MPTEPLHLYLWLGFVLAAVAAAAELYGNFSLTCTGVSLTNGSLLTASCLGLNGPEEGPLPRNRLDLAMCIGLDQVSGHLQWEV